MTDFPEREERRDDRGERGGYRGGGRFGRRRAETCECDDLSYKNPDTLRRFITDNGRIRPRRQTGYCAKCQRRLAVEVKRARHLALLPYTGSSPRDE